MDKEFEFNVEEFEYNGFYVNCKGTKADYKCNFIKWTADPGIFEADCSDGVVRLIPSCCIYDGRIKEEQFAESPKEGILFGEPSHS